MMVKDKNIHFFRPFFLPVVRHNPDFDGNRKRGGSDSISLLQISHDEVKSQVPLRS